MAKFNRNPEMTKEMMRIVDSGKLQIGSKTLDISDLFDRSDKASDEYRKKDFEEITPESLPKKEKLCRVDIVPTDSFSAAYPGGDHVAVLNFASSKHPGGGVLTGAMAQEESLCYCSNLYSVLAEHKQFYEYNNLYLCKSLYSDGIIFSEKIAVFKNSRYMNCKPFFVNVITCAAPNKEAALHAKVKEKEIDETMYRRLEQIMKTAAKYGTEHLVLGAFGCGVFKNDPSTVAQYTRELLFDKGYGYCFDRVSIPVMEKRGENYLSFTKVFKG